MQASTPSRRASTKLQRARRLWEYFQISHKGNYSVERMRAFRAYCETTWIKSFGIILGVPMPAVICILGLECIPLASPSAGWKANYMFYLRAFGFLLVSTICGCIQVLQGHPEAFLSPRMMTVTFVLAVTVEMATLVLLGYVWIFPVPFGLLFVTVAGVLPVAMTFIFVFKTTSSSNPSAYRTIGRTTLVLMVGQSALTVVYPAFSAVFIRLQGMEQAVLVLLLPIIKVLMKNFIANIYISMPKNIIHTTVFSVEIFNAFYVSTCMQAAVSPWSTVILILFDGFNSIAALYNVHRACQKVCEAKSKLQCHQQQDLLSIVLQCVPDRPKSTVANESCVTTKEMQSPKKCKVSPLPMEKKKAVNKVDMSSQQTLKETAIIPFSPTIHEVKTIKHLNAPSEKRRMTTSTHEVTISDEDKALFLRQTQSLLFRCEYLASLEYVEFVVPFIYTIYMSVLLYLPNAKYHIYFRHLTENKLHDSIDGIALYGGLEFLSFIAFVSYIRWKFGFSPIKLLGFTLETQGIIIIARSALFLLFVAQIPYPHFGMDLTFQFDYSDYP